MIPGSNTQDCQFCSALGRCHVHYKPPKGAKPLMA
jgi:hypothetical protein